MPESIKDRVHQGPHAHNQVGALPDSNAVQPHGSPGVDLAAVVQEKVRLRNRWANDESKVSAETPVRPGAIAVAAPGARSPSPQTLNVQQHDEESQSDHENVNETDSPMIQAELVDEKKTAPSEVVAAQPLDTGRNRKLAGLIFAVIVVAVVIAVSVGATLRSPETTSAEDNSAFTEINNGEGGRDHSLHVAYVQTSATCADTMHVILTCGGNKLEDVFSSDCVQDGNDKHADCYVSTNAAHVLAFECSIKEEVLVTDTVEIAAAEVQLVNATATPQCTDSVEFGLYRYCVDPDEGSVFVAREETSGMDSESAFSTVSECTADAETLRNTCIFDNSQNFTENNTFRSFPTILDNGLPECVFGDKKELNGFEDFLVAYSFA